MSYIRHHVIVATGSEHAKQQGTYQKIALVVHKYKDTLGVLMLSPLIVSPVNGYYSFALFPDGSKEGWDESGLGDQLRKEITEILEASDFDWVELSYGGDGGESVVVAESYKDEGCVVCGYTSNTLSHETPLCSYHEAYIF